MTNPTDSMSRDTGGGVSRDTATKKKRGHRGRRWLSERASRKTESGRRVRVLYRGFISKLNPHDPVHQAVAMEAAELKLASEELRKRLLAGEPCSDDVVRVQNAANRAARAVADMEGKRDAKPYGFDDIVAALKDDNHEDDES
jgi:hypothetical protein